MTEQILWQDTVVTVTPTAVWRGPNSFATKAIGVVTTVKDPQNPGYILFSFMSGFITWICYLIGSWEGGVFFGILCASFFLAYYMVERRTKVLVNISGIQYEICNYNKEETAIHVAGIIRNAANHSQRL